MGVSFLQHEAREGSGTTKGSSGATSSTVASERGQPHSELRCAAVSVKRTAPTASPAIGIGWPR
jgi:hypothetical protein